MSSEKLSHSQQLAQLENEYLAELPTRMKEIETAWQDYRNNGWNVNDLKQLHFYIHRVAGSAPTFGFPKLGEQAHRLELLLKPILHAVSDVTKIQQLKFSEQIFALLNCYQNSFLEPEQHINTLVSPQVDIESPLIYLLEDDAAIAKNLALQLGSYGYQVNIFSNLSSIDMAIRQQLPDLYIVDIMLNNDTFAGTSFVHKLKLIDKNPQPAIIYSSRSDFDARLSAVRAGVDAYFVKPMDIDTLVEKIESLLGRKPNRPYQVLLIDDDLSLAKHFSMVLSHAGIQVSIEIHAEKVLSVLEEISPDLIIMDIYMPICSGFELAKIIRQQAQLDSIPIIFLSTEHDIDKQLLAMQMGGDEFITKPVKDEHLTTAVLTRAKRARLLSDLIMLDGMTGLLKHARMKEQLVTEIYQATRSKLSFAFAMIDIDHFKNVNDTYGHLTGDRIIKSLAQLLRQRLRKSDIIARYGGEEFAVILHDSNRKGTFELIDSIRNDFSQLVHHCEEQEFHVSFSAGIAFFPDYNVAEELNQAADDALYQAKLKGRNQVVFSDEDQ
jgi:diguanylate cyclase (GGDEF)-like protein